ncbi:MAG TPA: hypothetical protein PLR20_14200 [Syntrophales bacterium]|nr:hypothetical protein [Syntrophales bacterium]HOX94020.1 hypothetical protein [Syntrophales bacterium]HPI58302.1 hypothetical protein [Syntrophales bacterium]HPN26120.1 hypothetical protein [Syntrophales bacterium]HQM30497.1 hypothetical protein [Syntrophales bacterium]
MGTSASRQTIYSIGPRRFQNQILADFLEKELDAKCVVSEDACREPPAANSRICQVLVLLHAAENDFDKSLMGLASENIKTLDGRIVALFNVKSDTGIEEKGVSWGIRGFFYKQDPPRQLVRGISCMFKGEMWYPREVMAKYILSLIDDNQNKRQDVATLTRGNLNC